MSINLLTAIPGYGTAVANTQAKNEKVAIKYLEAKIQKIKNEVAYRKAEFAHLKGTIIKDGYARVTQPGTVTQNVQLADEREQVLTFKRNLVTAKPRRTAEEKKELAESRAQLRAVKDFAEKTIPQLEEAIKEHKKALKEARINMIPFAGTVNTLVKGFRQIAMNVYIKVALTAMKLEGSPIFKTYENELKYSPIKALLDKNFKWNKSSTPGEIQGNLMVAKEILKENLEKTPAEKAQFQHSIRLNEDRQYLTKPIEPTTAPAQEAQPEKPSLLTKITNLFKALFNANKDYNRIEKGTVKTLKELLEARDRKLSDLVLPSPVNSVQ